MAGAGALPQHWAKRSQLCLLELHVCIWYWISTHDAMRSSGSRPCNADSLVLGLPVPLCSGALESTGQKVVAPIAILRTQVPERKICALGIINARELHRALEVTLLYILFMVADQG